MKTIMLLTAMVLASISFAHGGDCLRCNGKIACVGDTRAVLISACGRPDFSEEITTERKVGRGGKHESTGTSRIKYEYTYNCGEGRLMNIVTLVGGKIVAVESGGRGSGPLRCD